MSPGRDQPRIDVLLWVQHLLGIGHLQRAAAIGRALDRAGLNLVLVTGGAALHGLDVGGARVVQLPPIAARDQSFSALVDDQGREIDQAFKDRRRDQLLALYHDLRPRVLITEMFPFGRRQLRFELTALLEAARGDPARPWILSSLRDILNWPIKPEKAAWMIETAKRTYDLVLVHGDPSFAPLERSFPPAQALAERLRYTGYVVEQAEIGDAPSDDTDAGRGEVIVSTGGGAVAGPLIEAVFAGRALTALKRVPWRILVGENYPEPAFRRAQKAAPAGILVERARPDFPALLARCTLSISQAGYNTALQVLQAGPPAVLVPFAADGETEQSLRAELLAERGAAVVVTEAGLCGESLAAGVRRALDRRQGTGDLVAPLRLDSAGAQRSAEIVSALLSEAAR